MLQICPVTFTNHASHLDAVVAEAKKLGGLALIQSDVDLSAKGANYYSLGHRPRN